MTQHRTTLFASLTTLACLASTPAVPWTGAAHWESINQAVENLHTVDLSSPFALGPASVVLVLEQSLVMIDPVGDQAQFSRFGRPDIVILTKVAPSHLSVETMIGLLRRDTVVLAPQSVIDVLPLMISNNVITPFELGSTQIVDGIRFTAVPLDTTAPVDARVYQRVRGDFGVLIEVSGDKAYF